MARYFLVIILNNLNFAFRQLWHFFLIIKVNQLKIKFGTQLFCGNNNQSNSQQNSQSNVVRNLNKFEPGIVQQHPISVGVEVFLYDSEEAGRADPEETGSEPVGPEL